MKLSEARKVLAAESATCPLSCSLIAAPDFGGYAATLARALARCKNAAARASGRRNGSANTGEQAGLQEADGVLDHRFAVHQVVMRTLHDHEIGHALDPGSFDGHLAVVVTRQDSRHERVDRADAGNDTELEVHRAEPGGDTLVIGTELQEVNIKNAMGS